MARYKTFLWFETAAPGSVAIGAADRMRGRPAAMTDHPGAADGHGPAHFRIAAGVAAEAVQ